MGGGANINIYPSIVQAAATTKSHPRYSPEIQHQVTAMNNALQKIRELTHTHTHTHLYLTYTLFEEKLTSTVFLGRNRLITMSLKSGDTQNERFCRQGTYKKLTQLITLIEHD